MTTSLQGQGSDANAGVRFGQLSDEAAEEWAKLVLKNIDIEFPNKMSLVYVDADQVKTPRQNFPAFFGCFDWHSSVHGHWVLARLLRTKPEIPSATAIRRALNVHLTKQNLTKEAAFFAREEHKSFERMYGWAWYLRLVIELDDWEDSDAVRWRNNLRSLETILLKRIEDYLPLLTYPIRIGQHTDTGFALGQLWDYANATSNRELADLVKSRALAFYQGDRNYPISYEPSGHDFFSSCWNEADLMRRLLPPKDFVEWFQGFVPNVREQLVDGTVEPVSVSDVTDGKLVHLAGLNLNRAWCMRAIAGSLPKDHELRSPLLRSAEQHLRAGCGYVNSGSYEGDHWLATFALYAVVVDVQADSASVDQ